MNSLMGYGSDDDDSNDANQTDYHIGGWAKMVQNRSGSNTPSSTTTRQADVNYEEVGMDLSEESDDSGKDASSNPSSREKAGRERDDASRKFNDRDYDRYSRDSRPNSKYSRDNNSRSSPKYSSREESSRSSPNKYTSRDDNTRDKEKPRRDTSRDRLQRNTDRDRYEVSKDERSRSDRDRYDNDRFDDREKEKSSSSSKIERDRYDDREKDKSSSSKSDRDRDRYGRDDKYRDRKDRDRRDRRRSSSRDKDRKRGSRSPRRDRDSKRSRSRSPRDKNRSYRRFDRTNDKMAYLEKLGIDLNSTRDSHQNIPASDQQRGITSENQDGSANRFFMPGITGRFREQIERRKLLWQKNKPEPSETQVRAAGPSVNPTNGSAGSRTTKVWEATTFAQDNDGKVASKFKRLMGIKSNADTANSATDVLKKQEEMFSSMEQQYEVARTATHTMRGVGLGFGSFQR